ncbi:dihydrofolate reductase [Arundinibacter roseus]|uniref:Dihydrofolate reductase n=1 Tax=Arundinibacter roseus TaxID=2070510 RepID=A0A4R4K378_9BACT|nr:dihydrofolate reductase [Arundinibacter roseus]TDB61758.1 dihydrofolate reductase [Arundinibacter roseus]
MQISILVAVSENGVIGHNNQLLWRLPDDLKRFKQLTLGYPMIMGRKTFESIGKPLPGRTSIVLTRSGTWTYEGVLTATSLTEALEMAQAEGKDQCFIIGGGDIYRQALEQGIVDTLNLTYVHAYFEGDTSFEIPDSTRWEMTKQEFHPADERHPYAFEFRDLIRVTE